MSQPPVWTLPFSKIQCGEGITVSFRMGQSLVRTFRFFDVDGYSSEFLDAMIWTILRLRKRFSAQPKQLLQLSPKTYTLYIYSAAQFMWMKFVSFGSFLPKCSAEEEYLLG